MSPRKFKILMISARADYGGGPEHLFRLAQSVSDRIEIFIAAPDDEPYDLRYKALIGEASVFNIPHRRFSLICFLRLLNWVRRQKIQVIHSHGKGGGIYARFLGILLNLPVVHSFHGLHHGGYSGIFRWLYLMLERILAFKTAVLISVSRSELALLETLGLGSQSKRRLILNGVSLPTTKPLPLAERAYPFRILTVTRFDKAKNPWLLLPILEALMACRGEHEFVLEVIAAPEQEQGFMQEARKLGLDERIRYLGLEPDLSKRFLSASCYLSTSLWEGLPLAMMEAMSYGVPVVASRVVGNIDLIEEGSSGLLYDFNQPEAAAQHLSTLMENPDLWAQISENAQTRIRDGFSLKRMAHETLSAYKGALKSP